MKIFAAAISCLTYDEDGDAFRDEEPWSYHMTREGAMAAVEQDFAGGDTAYRWVGNDYEPADGIQEDDDRAWGVVLEIEVKP